MPNMRTRPSYSASISQEPNSMSLSFFLYQTIFYVGGRPAALYTSNIVTGRFCLINRKTVLGIEPGRHRSSSANRLYEARTLYSLSSYTGAQKASLFIHSFNHMCSLGIAVGGVRGVNLPEKKKSTIRENQILFNQSVKCCAVRGLLSFRCLFSPLFIGSFHLFITVEPSA